MSAVERRPATTGIVFVSTSKRPLLISFVAVIVGVVGVIAMAHQVHPPVHGNLGQNLTTVRP